MNLGEFKTELRAAMKRGASFDDRLGGFTRRAARWIEQNYTLQYMRRRILVQSEAANDTILLPTNVPIKSVEYIRFEGTDGTRIECSKGDLADPAVNWNTLSRYSAWPTNTLFPTRFYLDGLEALVFDRAFPEALAGQGIMSRYSDFPMADNQTHWLLLNAEGLMLRQALLEFLTDARDERGYAIAKAQREEDIRALLNADYEARYTGQDLQLGS